MKRPFFWRNTPLSEMTTEEWESLCDGCGRCCLHKLREDKTNAILHTNVTCRLLNNQTGRCNDYIHRQKKIMDCIHLTYEMLADIDWLPPTCAYRLLYQGQTLPTWHPLIAGHTQDMEKLRISVCAWDVINENQAGILEDYIVEWPGEDPTR